MVNRALWIAALGGTAVVSAIGVNAVLQQDNVAEPPAPTEEVAEVPTPKEKVAVSPTPKEKVAVSPTPTKEVAEPPSPTEKAALREPKQPPQIKTKLPEPVAPTPMPPSFDVVRVTPDGKAVIAGRAFPGSTVVIIDSGQFVGQLEADENGEWVFVPDKSMAPGSRQLSLQMRIGDGKPIPSEDVVMLVVPERDKDIVGRPASENSQALALKVPRRGSGSTVLQKPTAAVSKVGALSVDTIDYGDDGSLDISGRAKPGGNIYLYFNNDYTSQVRADGDGAWRAKPSTHIEPGMYTLRVDEVSNSGQVTSRISLPFSRAESQADLPPEPFVVVQPGNSLWRLARRSYGSGLQFTIIYEANNDQIQDPDLIFPGQIFAMPVTN